MCFSNFCLNIYIYIYMYCMKTFIYVFIYNARKSFSSCARTRPTQRHACTEAY